MGSATEGHRVEQRSSDSERRRWRSFAGQVRFRSGLHQPGAHRPRRAPSGRPSPALDAARLRPPSIVPRRPGRPSAPVRARPEDRRGLRGPCRPVRRRGPIHPDAPGPGLAASDSLEPISFDLVCIRPPLPRRPPSRHCSAPGRIIAAKPSRAGEGVSALAWSRCALRCLVRPLRLRCIVDWFGPGCVALAELPPPGLCPEDNQNPPQAPPRGPSHVAHNRPVGIATTGRMEPCRRRRSAAKEARVPTPGPRFVPRADETDHATADGPLLDGPPGRRPAEGRLGPQPRLRTAT